MGGQVNPSYEYAPNQYVYALWSQGFRRGGANSVPESGIFEESPLLRTYQPDKTNNYEAGLKGRFDNGLSYAFAIFDITWDKPQISSSLPSGNLAVYNANTAASRGFELESTGPTPIPKLSYSVGFAYADAKLTSNFSLPANNGTGTIVPGLLSGQSGEQLPGSPKNSFSAGLIYDAGLTPGYDLTLSCNGVYRSAVLTRSRPACRDYNRTAFLKLRGREPQCDAYAQTVARDALHHEPVRQRGVPGSAVASRIS